MTQNEIYLDEVYSSRWEFIKRDFIESVKSIGKSFKKDWKKSPMQTSLETLVISPLIIPLGIPFFVISALCDISNSRYLEQVGITQKRKAEWKFNHKKYINNIPRSFPSSY